MKENLAAPSNTPATYDYNKTAVLQKEVQDLTGQLAAMQPEIQHLRLKTARYEAKILLAMDALNFKAGDWNDPEIHRAEQIKIAYEHLASLGVEEKETAA